MIHIILLLNPVYATFFWFIALTLYNRRPNLPKQFLGWFMFTASIVYISHFFYFNQKFTIYYYIDSIYTLAYLMVYPLYHIYVRLLTVDASISFKKHFKFVAAPLLIFSLTFIGYTVMSKEQGMEFIQSILIDGKSPSGVYKYMYALFAAGRILFILQVFIYLFLSFKLIQENNIRLKDYYSNLEERKLNWVQFFNICFAFTSISSAILASVGRNVFLNNDILLVYPSVIFSVMLYFLGLLGSNQSAFFIEIENSKDPINEGKPILNLNSKIQGLFDKEMIFKNPDLKVWEVSAMLGVSINEVNNAIRNVFNSNFCSFVNGYRLNYAKQLFKNNPNLLNEQIAELSGFQSVKSLEKELQKNDKTSLVSYRKINESQ